MMELDDFKSDWKNVASDARPTEDLRRMMQQNSHPVLKGIRRQLLIETTLFTIFLLAYYNGFDGDQKPLYANILLVATVLLVIIHNILGYRAAQNIVAGADLIISIKNYLAKVRKYAIVSVASRVAAFACLIAFFGSTVSFSGDRWLFLLGALVVVCVQIFSLSMVWKKRIGSLETILNQLGES